MKLTLYYTHYSGPHSVEVCYDGSPVPKSPFRVAVTEGCDPARVRVHGPGLKGGITNKPNKFTVETRYVRQNFHLEELKVGMTPTMFVVFLLQRSRHWWSWFGNGGSIRGQDVLH